MHARTNTYTHTQTCTGIQINNYNFPLSTLNSFYWLCESFRKNLFSFQFNSNCCRFYCCWIWWHTILYIANFICKFDILKWWNLDWRAEICKYVYQQQLYGFKKFRLEYTIFLFFWHRNFCPRHLYMYLSMSARIYN